MTGPRKSSDVPLAVVFHQMLDRLDGAPSPPRCARCGHVRHHHALLPWMPQAERFGRCEHVRNDQPFYCNCPAYVPPASAGGRSK